MRHVQGVSQTAQKRDISGFPATSAHASSPFLSYDAYECKMTTGNLELPQLERNLP